MTSKTFESIDQTRQLHVKPLDKHVTLVINYKDAGRSGLTISHSDAPALCLAILEAAGVENVPHDIADGSERALGYLIEYVGLQQANERHAKEQAELEAEALELFNTFWRSDGEGPSSIENWRVPNEEREDWLAVARRAREMRTEK